MELEQELQRQLDQASVSGSVDSGKYDYRDLPTEFCFRYSNNTAALEDQAFNQHVQATAHSLSFLQSMEEEVSLGSDLSASQRSWTSTRRGSLHDTPATATASALPCDDDHKDRLPQSTVPVGESSYTPSYRYSCSSGLDSEVNPSRPPIRTVSLDHTMRPTAPCHYNTTSSKLGLAHARPGQGRVESGNVVPRPPPPPPLTRPQRESSYTPSYNYIHSSSLDSKANTSRPPIRTVSVDTAVNRQAPGHGISSSVLGLTNARQPMQGQGKVVPKPPPPLPQGGSSYTPSYRYIHSSSLESKVNPSRPPIRIVSPDKTLDPKASGHHYNDNIISSIQLGLATSRRPLQGQRRVASDTVVSKPPPPPPLLQRESSYTPSYNYIHSSSLTSKVNPSRPPIRIVSPDKTMIPHAPGYGISNSSSNNSSSSTEFGLSKALQPLQGHGEERLGPRKVDNDDILPKLFSKLRDNDQDKDNDHHDKHGEYQRTSLSRPRPPPPPPPRRVPPPPPPQRPRYNVAVQQHQQTTDTPVNVVDKTKTDRDSSDTTTRTSSDASMHPPPSLTLSSINSFTTSGYQQEQEQEQEQPPVNVIEDDASVDSLPTPECQRQQQQLAPQPQVHDVIDDDDDDDTASQCSYASCFENEGSEHGEEPVGDEASGHKDFVTAPAVVVESKDNPTKEPVQRTARFQRMLVVVVFLMVAIAAFAVVGGWNIATKPSTMTALPVPTTTPTTLIPRVTFEPTTATTTLPTSPPSMEPTPATTTTPTATTMIVPVPPPPKNCSSEPVQTIEGHVDLSFANADMNHIYAKQAELEALFQMAYNNASGMCEGLYQRVMYGATLRDMSMMVHLETTVFTIMTDWIGVVSCVGCPSSEPLFANAPTEDSLLMGPDVTHDQNGEFFLRFFEYFNQNLPHVLDLPTAEVVYMASIDTNTGNENHILDIQRKQAPPPSMPSVAQSSIPSTTF